MFNYDIFSKICEHLNDKQKIYLTMTCLTTDQFKYKLIYTNNIKAERINKLPYYDNFESIRTQDVDIIYPNNVKRINQLHEDLHLYCARTYDDRKRTHKSIPSSVTHLTVCARMIRYISLPLPKSVTHLKFCWMCPIFDGAIISSSSITHLSFPNGFDQSVKGIIPHTVTHLKFGCAFDRPINDCIPNSVIRLTFKYKFNQYIKGCIPSSVTHLKFGHCFNQPIDDAVPNSVTHLRFGNKFEQPIENAIPKSVTHLTFEYSYNSFNGLLPATVTHLHIKNAFYNTQPDDFHLIRFRNWGRRQVVFTYDANYVD